MVEQKLGWAFDFDGPILDDSGPFHLLKVATKWGLPLQPGVLTGINYLASQTDTAFLGWRTKRPPILEHVRRFPFIHRKITPDTIEKHNLPSMPLVHTSFRFADKESYRVTGKRVENGSLHKVTRIFQDVTRRDTRGVPILNEQNERQLDPKYKGLVLVDDSDKSVLDAFAALAKRPEMQLLISNIVYVHFKPGAVLRSHDHESGVHVITMSGWNQIEDVRRMILDRQ